MHLSQLLGRRRRTHSDFPGWPYDPATPIHFMHIPETLGVALDDSLQTALRPCRPVGEFDRMLFGGFDALDSLGPKLRAQIYLSPAELPSAPDFVAGHMSFVMLSNCYGAANILTVRREPAS